MSRIKTILNEKKEKIFVELFDPKEVNGTVVFCHGITGCRKGRTIEDDYLQKLAQKICNYNYKVVLFDYSGHGDSEGNDYDVSLLKNTEELKRVIEEEVDLEKDIKFLAFSYGATVLCNYLNDNTEINPSRIVLFSPCFYPLESCFLNEKSIFGKDIVAAYKNGDLEKIGYTVVGAKNFKFGYKMIEECRGFNPDRFIVFADRILVLCGKQDVILDTSYNDKFCAENNISIQYFDASHSLYETIEEVGDVTIGFFGLE